MTTSATLQVLTFATSCCDPVTYTWVNTWNQTRIYTSVATRDRFGMIKINIDPGELILLLISAQN
jgi:hypothetical protein